MAAYSGHGAWARLFTRADGFVGTRLLAPEEAGGSWLTLDEWESRVAFDRFHEEYGDSYRSLDEELAGMTADERFIGAFDSA